MPRTLTKATLASAAALAVLPASAIAAPTINSGPNPSTAGDPVVIYGTAKAGSKVVLYHRVNPAKRFTIIQRTTADTAGRYEFTRADGVVESNRNWYVRAAGERSPVVHQRVSAVVGVDGPDSPNLQTKTNYIFTGTVTPAHPNDKVELQRQVGTGAAQHWKTIDRGQIGRGGGYSIKHRFSAVGDANLRVHLDADRRNLASDSEVLPYEVSEKQRPGISIATTQNPLNAGGSTTISGRLAGVDKPTAVTLYGHVYNRGFSPVATATTDASGNYTFANQSPVANTVFQVRGGGKKSASLYEGVKDVVSASADKTSLTAGDTVNFTGSVSPDKTGHKIFLERQNANGRGFHVVKVASVGAGSRFAISRRVTDAGTKVFRVFITGGPVNQSGASAPITLNVAANSAPLTN